MTIQVNNKYFLEGLRNVTHAQFYLNNPIDSDLTKLGTVQFSVLSTHVRFNNPTIHIKLDVCSGLNVANGLKNELKKKINDASSCFSF